VLSLAPVEASNTLTVPLRTGTAKAVRLFGEATNTPWCVVPYTSHRMTLDVL
jgi:hypothetical protein